MKLFLFCGMLVGMSTMQARYGPVISVWTPDATAEIVERALGDQSVALSQWLGWTAIVTKVERPIAVLGGVTLGQFVGHEGHGHAETRFTFIYELGPGEALPEAPFLVSHLGLIKNPDRAEVKRLSAGFARRAQQWSPVAVHADFFIFADGEIFGQDRSGRRAELAERSQAVKGLLHELSVGGSDRAAEVLSAAKQSDKRWRIWAADQVLSSPNLADCITRLRRVQSVLPNGGVLRSSVCLRI